MRADHQDPANLGALTGIMRDIAGEHPGQVIVLDSDEVWGPVFTQDVNGDKVPERKPDGVHVCPSGAAMYAIWLTASCSNGSPISCPLPSPLGRRRLGQRPRATPTRRNLRRPPVRATSVSVPPGVHGNTRTEASAGAGGLGGDQVAIDIDRQLDDRGGQSQVAVLLQQGLGLGR